MNYTIERMNISDVCRWLNGIGNNDDTRVETQLSIALAMYYKMNGKDMERTDMLKDIFIKTIDNGADVFRSMECDVTTHMQFTPAYEAHVD